MTSRSSVLRDIANSQTQMQAGVGSPYQSQSQSQMTSSGPYVADVDASPVAHPKHTANRVYVVTIDGCAAEFACNPAKAQRLIGSHFSFQYRPFDKPVGSERSGDVSRGYLVCAKIQWVKNTFPFDVMLCSDSLRGRYYSGSTQRGIFAVPRDSLLTYETGLKIIEPTVKLTGKAFLTYGHCTMDAFNGCITELRPVGKEVSYLVSTEGIAAKLLIRNQVNQITNARQYNLDDWALYGRDQVVTGYQLTKANYDNLLKFYQQNIVGQMPHTDFSSLGIHLERIGVPSWDASSGVFYPGGVESADGALLHSHGSLSAAIELTYRLMH